MGSGKRKCRATKTSHSKRRRTNRRRRRHTGWNLRVWTEVRMCMHLTKVHKPLTSAHRSLRANVTHMNEAGGMLFLKDSVPGKRLEAYAAKLNLRQVRAHGSATLPRERGVQHVRQA
eukprot:3186948-Amphidinium_carterae.2